MAAAIGQRPIAPVQEIPAAPASNFSKEKVTRLALRALALIGEVARVFLCAYILTGGISLWHIFIVLGVSAAINKCWNSAKEIVDLKDPEEVKELSRTFPGLNIGKMLEKYPLETILRLDLVRLDTLRVRFATGCDEESRFPVLKQHADSLLRDQVITPEMHRLLVAGDMAGLKRMMPNNTVDLARMFQQ